MTSGFTNQPKILRGAFVEYGLSLPPLIVVFQFNPQTITRARSATVEAPDTPDGARATQNMSLFSQISASSLASNVRRGQTIKVNQETLSFEVRLDATDKLNAGDKLTQMFGVAPQLSTLELMMTPKNQSLMGGAAAALLGMAAQSYSFCDEAKNPPIILFVWGRKKVLPVNITSMSINEEEFSTDLNPVRATVNVSLEVIEGPNAPYLYTRALKEAMSVLNLANALDIAHTIVPS